MSLTFKKAERIYKRDEIGALFEKGNSFLVHPFKVLHICIDKTEVEDSSIKVGFSIPKRRFKKAVDRNLLKRRAKEAYRLSREGLKTELLESEQSLLIMFIYVDKTILPYDKISPKIKLILDRLQQLYAESTD